MVTFQLSQKHKALFMVVLPLIAVVMLLAQHTFFVTDGTTLLQIAGLFIGYLFQAIPLLVGHLAMFAQKRYSPLLIWLVSFVCYPLILLLTVNENTLGTGFIFHDEANVVALAVISLLIYLRQSSSKNKQGNAGVVISKLFALDTIVVIMLVLWVLVITGVFASHQNPLENQPIPMVIKSDQIFRAESTFGFYLWQFFVMASLMFSVYLTIRYILVRKVLTQYGVIAFLSASTMVILLLTPLVGQIILWLPLNIPEYSLLPSANYELYAPLNYRVMFWIVAIGTPVVLAFERQQQSVSLAEISKQQVKTELRLLQQQINPHFLFNTLNNLYALTLEKSDSAPDLVMGLSNLLRYSVYEGQKESVLLKQELDYLKDYVALQRIRFGDHCDIDLQLPTTAGDYYVAPLLVINLVENAFKYGAEPALGQCEIKLHISIDQGKLRFSCINPIWQTPVTKKGVGLANLERRLALIYPGRYTFSSQQQDKKWHANLTLELDK